MDAISTGYANYFTNPAAATSTPSNFGPGQVIGSSGSGDGSQNDTTQTQLQQASSVVQAATGYTTATRGGQINISV